MAGDYEISYALTGKAEEADQTPEGDDQTSDTDTADQDKPDQPADEEKQQIRMKRTVQKTR